ncbi:MAG: preprotein translocase subunit SecE [Dehalococcoidia bacterium]|nr:preprotein translocase subunit SecE [Dehalococcoidia bacterium]
MARSGPGGLLRRPSTGEAGPRRGVFQFFGEVVSELKKVTWPSRQETIRLTLLVIAVSVAIGVVLGVLDLLFTRLVDIVLF